MAATPQQLASMEAAYYSGEKHVSFGDRTVTYHDLPDLWQAILNARQDMAGAAGLISGGPRRVIFTTQRGH